jgi:hypothetical protein
MSLPVSHSIDNLQAEEKLLSDSSTKVELEKAFQQQKEEISDNDIHKESANPHDAEYGTRAVQAASHPRQNLPTWKWIFTVVCLGLGAMLYGMALFDARK